MRTCPSGRRLFVAGRGWFRCRARTRPSGRRLLLLGRVGRAGLLGAFWCASPFPLAALSFCLAWPPPGWGCPPLSRCCCRSSLPWGCVLVVFQASRCVALRALSPRLCLPLGRWLLPSPFVSRGFRRSCLVPRCFFFFFSSSSSSVRPRCLQLSPVSGPRCPGPRRCALFALLAFRFLALRALSPPSCFPPGCWLLPGGCCPPPPPCVSRFSSLPLPAVCRVLCCAVCPWALCCAALLRVVSPGAVLSCGVLLCCARLVPLLVAPCPLAPPVALGPCALRRCVLRCSPTLCALCCVCFVVVWWCVLCVSRGAVLCVPCPLRSVRCCVSLCWCARVVLFVWCVLLLAPGAVVRCCVLCCFLWCAVVRCWVWWPVVVCWWCVSVSVSLSGRVVCFPVVGVVCCGALLSCVVFCGAVLSRGAVLLCSAVVLRCCWGLLCPPVACRAVLCCAVGWLPFFLPAGGVCVLWCSFPRAVCSLSSPLCALRCLVVLAVVPCFPVSCAVALCGRVVLCCRALLSFCGAVCVCFALLRPVLRRRAVLCCAVGCLCCFLPGGGVCVLRCPFLPARTKTNINHLTCHPALVAVSWLACLGGCGVLDLTPRAFHLPRKGGENVEGGARAGGEGTW